MNTEHRDALFVNKAHHTTNSTGKPKVSKSIKRVKLNVFGQYKLHITLRNIYVKLVDSVK